MADLSQIDPNDELLLTSLSNDPTLSADDRNLVNSIRQDHAITALQSKQQDVPGNWNPEQGIRPEAPLETAGNIGKFIAHNLKAIGQYAGLPENSRLNNLVDLVIPQNDAAVAAMAFQALRPAVNVASKELGPLSNKLLQVEPLNQPGVLDKLGGAAMQTTSALPQRYGAAILANPDIMSAETPAVADVVKEYTRVLNERGMKIDSDLMKEVMGSRFGPSDTQVTKLKDIVENALNKIEQPETFGNLQENEALLARQAAASLQRTNDAAKNPRFMSVASGAKDALDNFLENSSLPETRDLARLYFKAQAKEAASSLMPLNKNLSPNALRGLIMGKMFIDAAKQGAQGNLMEAGQSALQGAAMSPAILTAPLRGMANAPSIPAKVGIPASNFLLNKLGGNEDEQQQ